MTRLSSSEEEAAEEEEEEEEEEEKDEEEDDADDEEDEEEDDAEEEEEEFRPTRTRARNPPGLVLSPLATAWLLPLFLGTGHTRPRMIHLPLSETRLLSWARAAFSCIHCLIDSSFSKTMASRNSSHTMERRSITRTGVRCQGHVGQPEETPIEQRATHTTNTTNV